MIAIDWGASFTPRRPKPHAAVRRSGVKIVKFRHAQGFAERVLVPAAVFVESSGLYIAFCELYDAYRATA